MKAGWANAICALETALIEFFNNIGRFEPADRDPANGWSRRFSPVGGRPSDGLLTEQIADARGCCRELVKMPLSGRPGQGQKTPGLDAYLDEFRRATARARAQGVSAQQIILDSQRRAPEPPPAL